MAFFYRLGALFFLACTLCMLLVPTSVHASFPSTATSQWLAENDGVWLDEIGAAAAGSVGVKYGCDGYSIYRARLCGAQTALPSTFYYQYDYCGTTNPTFSCDTGTLSTRTVQTCPAGATLSGSSCTCNSGFSESGGTCKSTAVADKESCDALAAGLNYLKEPLVHFGAVGLTACFGGFVLAGSGGAAGGGQSELYGPFKCGSDVPVNCSVVPKPASGTATCAKGTFPGTVNGVQVCVPSSTSVAAGPSTVASAPSGAASAPSIEGAPSGSTGSTTTTNCAAGACTTTTTYTGSGGTPTGTRDVVESESSYCQKNPLASICKVKTDSSFSGSCTSTPVCSGDAIQCAVAAQSMKTACALQSTDPKTTEENAYTAGILKTGDQTLDLAKNPAPVELSGASFDQTELLGAAVGMTDLTVTVFRSVVTLPFSQINIWLQRLGMILQAVTFLLCMRIVSRG